MTRRFANVMVWFLNLLLSLAAIELNLEGDPTPPQGGVDLGETDLVQVGVAVLTITSGSGPSLRTYFTGYWTASGN